MLHVALSTYTDLAQPISFQPTLLEQVVQSAIPTFEQMKGADIASSFKNLSPPEGEDPFLFSFHQVSALLLFVADALINNGSTDPAMLGILIVAVTSVMLELQKDD